MKCKCEHCGWENSLEKVYCDNCRRPLVKDVFISYSRKDYVDSSGKPFEGNILSTLKSFLFKRGISFWFDEEGIFSGDEFAGVLTQAIRSAKVFLFVSSVNSNKSPWTSREISVALLHKKVIIPFKIDDSPYNDSVAMKISELDWIDYSNSPGLAMAKLERALRHHLPDPPAVGLQTGQGSSENSDQKDIHNPMEEDGSSPHSGLRVCVSDTKTPLVMLVGPPGVGKTMTLVRLSRFLREHGASVYPDRSFRPGDDSRYERQCANFKDFLDSPYAASRTGHSDCLLLKVDMDGYRKIQIADLSGDLFSTESDSYPAYFNYLSVTANPRIWALFFDLSWNDPTQRLEYVKKIARLHTRFRREDKVVIIINKIDQLPWVNIWNVDSKTTNALIKELDDKYPGLRTIFPEQSWKFFRGSNCEIIPFTTGFYEGTDAAFRSYSQSPSQFPRLLWVELINWRRSSFISKVMSALAPENDEI